MTLEEEHIRYNIKPIEFANLNNESVKRYRENLTLDKQLLMNYCTSR